MTTGASKRAIWESAQRLFSERGFAQTSVREIAADASADPALVIRHYGSKERLFLDTMRPRLETMTELDGPLSDLGERIIAALLGAQDEVRGVYLALLRASDSPDIRTQLVEAHELWFVGPIAERLDGPDAETRARLAAAVVGGLLYSLWVVGDESLLALDCAELVARYGAVLQRALDG